MKPNINKTSKLLEWCLYLCVLVAPMRCYGLGRLGWGNFSLFRFFGIIMIILTLFEMVKRRVLILSKSMMAIILILSSSILTLAYSTNTGVSNFSVMVIGLFWLFNALIVLQLKPYLIDNIIVSFVLSAILPVGFGIYQYFMYVLTKKLPPFPFASLLISEGKTGLLYRSELRIMSFFLDPSYYGMFLIAVILVLTCIFLNKKSFRPMKNKVFSVISFLVLLASIISLFTTLSITAFLGLFGGLLLLVLFGSNRKAVKTAIFLSFALLVLLFMLDKFFNLNFIELLIWKYQSETATHGITGGRSEHLLNALDKWTSSPLFGVGFGDLAINGRSYSAHNTLLTILGQQGLVGFLIHIYFLLFLPIRYFVKSKKNMYDLIAFVPIMAILIQSLGYDLIYKLDSYYVLLLISFAIFEYCCKVEDNKITI